MYSGMEKDRKEEAEENGREGEKQQGDGCWEGCGGDGGV